MKFPELVPDRLCKMDIHVSIEAEGLDEDGAQIMALDADFKCNYQDKAKRVLTAEQKLVQISGVALFNGDIAPELAAISGGEVTVFGAKRRILQGTKARNPDGTVNFTRLELI